MLPFSAPQQRKISPGRTTGAHRLRLPMRLSAARWAYLLLALASSASLLGERSSQDQTQPAEVRSSSSPSATNSADPKALAQRCVAHEAELILHRNSFLRYRMHTVDEKGDQVRDQIETSEGLVARLILRDGKPLTQEEDTAERGRLNYLLDTPASFAHHIKNEQTNKKMGIDVLKLIPDAMLWSYAPGQPPLPDHTASEFSRPLVVLDFKPNPAWSPPTLPAQALTGLAGRVWIDAEAQQMIQLEGSLIKPVNVGWGMLAHLYPGASLSLHQTPAAGDRWIVDHVIEQLNVRALMLKTIHQRLMYETSSYQQVPAMTYPQAIKILLETPLPAR
jgi:hypothetical protein